MGSRGRPAAEPGSERRSAESRRWRADRAGAPFASPRFHTDAYGKRSPARVRCGSDVGVALTRTPRERWIAEGLTALAAGGPEAVRVEALGRVLGVSKGGFYWQFADRRA